jgi:preprotein translocase subunit SecF
MSICTLIIYYTAVAALITVTSYSMAATGRVRERVRERVRQVRIDIGVFNRRRGRERTIAVAIHTSTD